MGITWQSIILGYSTLFVGSYLFLAFFNFVFLGFSEYSNSVSGIRMLLKTLLLTLAWVLAFYTLMMFVSSSGVVLFAIAAFILLGIIGFFFSHLFLDFETQKDKIIYAIVLAFICNPGWLALIGIL